MSNKTTTSKTPSHAVYHVREGQKAIWTRLGSAWPHGDGKGFSIQMDAIPVDGRISLRLIEQEK